MITELIGYIYGQFILAYMGKQTNTQPQLEPPLLAWFDFNLSMAW